MKEHPIIMSGNHPKLILDGIKTMTRRTYGLSLVNDPPQNMANWQLVAVFQDGCARFATPDGKGDVTLVCPYGGYGDRLWVRETHQYLNVALTAWEHDFGVKYKADGECKWWRDNGNLMNYPINEKNRPSIHTPRWASRITLEITELWAELLRSISPADALAEGGYTVEEFIKLYLKINHLPDDADPWNWVIKYKLLGMGD